MTPIIKTNTLLVVMLTLFVCVAQPSLASPLTDRIQEAVKQYVASQLSSNIDYELKVGQLDSRLKLPPCHQPLNVFTHMDTIKPGRNSIGVSCPDKKKWTIYTTAIVQIYRNVIVLSQPVRRGEKVDKSNLEFKKKDISNLRMGYFTDLAPLLNKQYSKNLSPGAVINASNITEPKLIKRGEKVTITASSSNLSISMAGVALMDGKKNQNIKVKNLKTKQIIQATVVSRGKVMVIF